RDEPVECVEVVADRTGRGGDVSVPFGDSPQLLGTWEGPRRGLRLAVLPRRREVPLNRAWATERRQLDPEIRVEPVVELRVEEADALERASSDERCGLKDAVQSEDGGLPAELDVPPREELCKLAAP